jgi:hypothetical protein
MAGGADASAARDNVPYAPSRITTAPVANRRKTVWIVVFIANLPSKLMGVYQAPALRPGVHPAYVHRLPYAGVLSVYATNEHPPNRHDRL